MPGAQKALCVFLPEEVLSLLFSEELEIDFRTWCGHGSFRNILHSLSTQDTLESVCLSLDISGPFG